MLIKGNGHFDQIVKRKDQFENSTSDFNKKIKLIHFFRLQKNTVFTGDEIVAGFAYKIQILDSGKKDLGNFGHINVFFSQRSFAKYEKFCKIEQFVTNQPSTPYFQQHLKKNLVS